PSATDDWGAVGVQSKLEGTNLVAEVLAAPHTISWNTTTAANAAHTMTAVARDAAGNTATAAAISVTVANDTTPPTSSATPSPPPNVNGWNNTSVTVPLAATDNPGGSGVQSITYTLTGAQTGSAEVPGNTASFTISAEGTTTVTFYATDNAGNV